MLGHRSFDCSFHHALDSTRFLGIAVPKSFANASGASSLVFLRIFMENKSFLICQSNFQNTHSAVLLNHD